MKVSLNIVKQFTSVNLPVADLVTKINNQLGGVEEVIDLSVRYKDVVIVKIMSAVQHPNADRLSICKVDDGSVVADMERDEHGYVQVVCGAPNAREGIFVAWLPPQSTVPASFDEKELFVLGSRELRGVMSHGMLAAADELAIGSDHDGILEINPDEWKPTELAITPGASFAQAYGLDDTIIDIENKMFTHRPDLFGQLGVARELAGIQHQAFTSPQWYRELETGAWDVADGSALPLTVFNDTPDNAPRFMSVVMKDVTVKPSPLWLQAALTALGSKPINNVVDVTNYIMLLTAQPVHAYDYDRLVDHTVGVRMARAGEKVTLLNHKEYQLSEDDIVIADGSGPVGLAGVMGGGESEVSDDTKNIVLEVATFDMYAVRKTAMRHGVFTDALTRFNKGQSPLQNPYVLHLLMKSLQDVTGGQPASDMFDLGQPKTLPSVHVTERFINERLGLSLDRSEITSLLRNVEIDAVDTDDALMVTPPFWRTDIELPEDIVEEVGRLYGFDRLPRELPIRTAKPTPRNAQRELAQEIRESLSRAGANEVLTYSFVHENILRNAGQNPAQAFRLGNALSPDLQYYRLSMTPSLLDKVHANIKAGHDEFAIFELGKGHSKKAISEVDNLPVEMLRLGLTYAAKTAKAGAPYYRVKALVEYLATSLGLSISFKALPTETSLTFATPFEPRRSARVVDIASGQSLGVIGEYVSSVSKKFKLPAYSAGFELLPEAIMLAQKHAKNGYTPLSRYPGTQRDICFQVAESVNYDQITDVVAATLVDDEYETSVEPVDIYQGEGAEVKNVTIRISLAAHDRTLTADDASTIVDRVVTAVIAQTNAVVV